MKWGRIEFRRNFFRSNVVLFGCALTVFYWSTVAADAPKMPKPISFTHDVLPILSKAGCNTGGCHGALAGKAEFRLSLDGYDPVADYYTITQETRGRRIEFAAPARSLVLTKPTAAVKHKGGKVLREGSADYKMLVDWIKQGAPGPSQDEPDVERIELQPTKALVKKGDTLKFKVMAFFSDGTERNVTPWVRWDSTDATVAEIDKKTGEVTVIGFGEGAVTAWYSSRVAMARVTSPWPKTVDAKVYADAPKRNAIDKLVMEQLQQLQLVPSPRSRDSVFIRRAFLDTIGVLPTVEETKAFLADKRADKRDKLIEALLARPEFVDYWTYRWSDLFLISGKKLRPDAIKAYYDWLRKGIAENKPWDELVREVLTAKGSSVKNGATNFYAVHQDPENMAENVSQAFMSLSINCAKCHNHPLEKWTNDQYYQFANLFARVQAKGWGGDFRSGDGKRELFVASRGDLIQPRTGRPQPPAPLDAPAIPADDPGDRREALADWLASPENPYFTRSIANRVWAAYFGRGIVEPVDDLRVSNPASNEPLLDELAAFLAKENYDLRALMRLILQSETYQRSSVAVPGNEADTKNFSRYYPRRMMAEVLDDAISGVTGVPSSFTKITMLDGSTQNTKFYEEGTRALELYDSAVTSYFLSTFGRNEREITCECERSGKPSMVQVLHLSNGKTVNEKLQNEKGRLSEWLKDEKAVFGDLIDRAYLECLSRPPKDAERKRLLKVMNAAKKEERQAVAEDLYWALLTSREFLFQH